MRFLRDLSKPIFVSPYPLLPWAAFLFFCACFLLHPLSPIYTHQLADPDDYMRLNEVLNWLFGQSWLDLSQPRLSPGAHTVIHWSRLVDLPIALITLPLSHFFAMRDAALIASFLVPPALFALLLLLLPHLAKSITGNARANLTSLFILFAPLVLFNFTPGRVDHHAYQIMIAGFGLFCLERIVNDAKTWRYAVMSAVAFACGLWIGTEALPWLLIFTGCLGILAAWQGGYLLRHAVLFGLSLLAVTALILPLALPQSEFSSLALSWFSLADVVFAGLVAALFTLNWLLGRQTKKRGLRLTLMASSATFASILFIYFVPSVLAGPFADYDAFNSTTALDNIIEAQPLWHGFRIDIQNPLTLLDAFKTFIRIVALPLAALLTIAWHIRHTHGRPQKAWLLHGAFLLAAFLLTLFWQIRVGYFMQLFTVAPITVLAGAAWDYTGKKLKGRPHVWAEAGVFIALGAGPVILFPALFDYTAFYPDMLLFPAARAVANCPLTNTTAFLNQHYAGKDLVIMASLNEGPELLFRTPFKAIGGNYNVSGNQDVFDFFHSRSDAEAKTIAHKWKADVVLLCRNIAPFMAGLDHPRFGTNAFLRPTSDGHLRLSSGLKNPVLIEKIINNQQPNWLISIPIPGQSDYLLFEIRR